MTVDLSSLNDTERRMLALLARGHTVKSIAAETGTSIHAVNERLREARRKTGVGSSRELARLLPQENWDKQIDLAASAPGGAPAAHQQHRKGWLVMALIGTTAIAITALAALLGSPQTPAAPPRVVATAPGQGASVPAGAVTISVTFDRPMRANSYSFVQMDATSYPDCPAKPRISADGRTFLLDCTLIAGRNYAIGFNGGRYHNFVSADGLPAEPAMLRFRAR